MDLFTYHCASMRTNLFTVNYAFNKSCCFWKKLLANVTMSAIRIKSQHCQLVSSGKQLRVEVSWNHSKRSHVSDHIAHGIFPFYFFFFYFFFFLLTEVQPLFLPPCRLSLTQHSTESEPRISRGTNICPIFPFCCSHCRSWDCL